MQATRAPRDKLYAGDKHSFGVRRGREQGPDSLYLGGICQWRNQGSEPTSPNLVLTQPPHLHLLAAPWGLAQSKDEAGEAVVVQGLRQIQGPRKSSLADGASHQQGALLSQGHKNGFQH